MKYKTLWEYLRAFLDEGAYEFALYEPKLAENGWGMIFPDPTCFAERLRDEVVDIIRRNDDFENWVIDVIDIYDRVVATIPLKDWDLSEEKKEAGLRYCRIYDKQAKEFTYGGDFLTEYEKDDISSDIKYEYRQDGHTPDQAERMFEDDYEVITYDFNYNEIKE